MFVIDIAAFVLFMTTALIWWVPVFVFFFLPFYLMRLVKRWVSKTAHKIQQESDKRLDAFMLSRQTMTAARSLEKHTKALHNDLAHKTYKKTVWWTRFEILEQIPMNSRVLDIGCGNGYLAKLVQESRKAEVTCVDVANYNETDIKTILFDGVHLPFDDNSFDVVILSFVLHHSNLQKELLTESHRVCRGRVVIYEDEAVVIPQFFEKIHELGYNWQYNMKSPVTYRSPHEWQQLFHETGFQVSLHKSSWGIGSVTNPIKKIVFVLTPRK